MYNDFSDCNTVTQVQEKAKKLQREREEKEQMLSYINTISNCSSEVVYNQKEMIDNQQKEIERLTELNQLQKGQLVLLKNLLSNHELSNQLEKQMLDILKEKYEPNHPIWEQIKNLSKSSMTGVLTETALVALKQILQSCGLYL